MSQGLWSEIVTDLGDDLAHLVKEELLRGWHTEAVLSATRQRRIAEANARIEHCAIEGIGQQTMSVDADAFYSWQAAEPGCWQDKGFRDWFKRRNPETAVGYTPRSTTILRP
jgi:hypothetical protein